MYVCTVSTARSQAEDTKLFHSTLSRGVAGNGGLWGPETQIGYEGPRSAMRGGPAAKPSELFHSSTIAGVLDVRNLAARLRPSVSCLGGGGVLEALRAVSDTAPFRAGVAFYPVCEGVRPWKAPIPVVMLLGALDDVAPARSCQSLVRKLPAASPVSVHIYDGARHGFDASELVGVVRHPAGTMAYNEAAATAAWGEVRKLLGR